MKTKISFLSKLLFTFSFLLFTFNSFAQGVSINSTGNEPDASAVLDVSSTAIPFQGLLLPRLTTVQRNEISAPVESLLIYNTTTQCYEGYNGNTSTWIAFGCIGCIVPSGVTATASTNSICAGSTLTLTGEATDATSWSWTGPNSFTSSLQSPTITNITTDGTGVYTLAASNNCGSVTASTVSVTVSAAAPTEVSASADVNPICEGSTLTLTGGATDATSWSWTGPNSYTSSLQSPSIESITTVGAGDYVLSASNGCGSATSNTVSVTVNTTPTAPTAGTHTPSETQIIWNWNAVSGVTGYKWSTTNSYSAATDMGTSTSKTETDLTCETAYTRYVWAYDDCGGSTSLVLSETTNAEIGNVTNPTTGKTWMDRNLGASQVATSSTDYLAYGDLYQWGRAADGHEHINWTSSTSSDGAEQSNETSTLSISDTPGHDDFIKIGSTPNDWHSLPQNDNLWQGVNGINNPCPSGYRLPTEAELSAERATWSSQNSVGAFASPLKLPVAGTRRSSDGSLNYVGSSSRYWSSTIIDTHSYCLSIDSNAYMLSSYRAGAISVRCIKD